MRKATPVYLGKHDVVAITLWCRRIPQTGFSFGPPDHATGIPDALSGVSPPARCA